MDLEKAPTMAAAKQLGVYRTLLQRYRDLDRENNERQATMAETTQEINEKTKQIYDLNYDRYLNGLLIQEELEQQSELRFAFLEGANTLMRATLAARQAEAVFQLDPSAES